MPAAKMQLTKFNIQPSQNNLLGWASDVSSCGTAACYKEFDLVQFCNKTGKVSDSITVKTILHTTASIMTYHFLFLSLPYLQECHPLDKNNATISKHKYRTAAC